MQGLRVPVSAATAAATVGPQAIPFTLSPSAAAVLSQHGLTTQALSRLYATTVSSVAPTSGGGGMQVATTAAAAAAQVGQSLQRQLSTGSGETTNTLTYRDACAHTLLKSLSVLQNSCSLHHGIGRAGFPSY